jgi:glyoxylase-like metal-dependent hydrolase (beta-lactamase superfamily II)
MIGPLCVPLGIANSYLLPARDGYVLIDAGSRGTAGRLFAALARHGITPAEIRLIVLTHTHFDHVGGLQAILERCGAPVMVHEAEVAWLAEGRVVIPRGVYPHTRVLSAVGRRLRAAFRFNPYRADYVVAGGQSLTPFGLEARLVHTPGHSPGSMTMLLESGAAYIGDLCYNAFPFGLGPIHPLYADDLPTLYASWRTLAETHATMLYPAHGRPFPASALRDRLSDLRRARRPRRYSPGIGASRTSDGHRARR